MGTRWHGYAGSAAPASRAIDRYVTIGSVLVPGRWRYEHSRLSSVATTRLYRIVSALAFQMEYTQAPDELLEALVEIVAAEMGVPYVLVELSDGVLGEAQAAHGTPVEPSLSLPLTYQGRPVGSLVVGSQRRLPRRAQRVLVDVARHAGAALHVAHLLTDLRQSLDGNLDAREVERRRLRHELHDSLGPILAGITLGLHAARRVMPRAPDQADQLISHLEQELQTAIAEVRRLFETLRPSALDRQGLVPAVREHIDILATRLRNTDDSGDVSSVQVAFELQSSGDFAALPAVVEVAAYRIVCEALTNVARHSSARTCRVKLVRDKGVQVEVVDDGVGFYGRASRGLGIGSMRERATELGGSFAIETPATGGTRVVASLPVRPTTAVT